MMVTGATTAVPAGSAARDHDPLTGFGSREKLFADLTRALRPESPPAVFAVFDLSGSSDYRRIHGGAASDRLIAQLAERFALLVRPSGRCYRSRQDEFCALVTGQVDAVTAILFAAEDMLNHEGAPFLLAAFGAAVLPDATDDPVDVLMLADERVASRLASRAPRRRREPSPRREG